MIRIRLVVTGDVEEVALATALRQLFPNTEWSTVKKNAGNSNRLSRTPTKPRSEFVQFVDEMLACGLIERVPGGQPFDYVLVVDDLELTNVDQPDVALAHLRLAIETRLAQWPTEVPTIPKGKNKHWPYPNNGAGGRAYLRERCSYHLLSPMIESLFFGEHEPGLTTSIQHWPALRRAGAQQPPVFDAHAMDVEQFLTTDPAYYMSDPRWSTPPLSDPTWRSRHPKHYLTFLCDPSGTSWRPYRERTGGKAGLERIHWPSIVAPPKHACFVRAMLEDIADMAGTHLPWLDIGHQHPLTQRKPAGILRNIST